MTFPYSKSNVITMVLVYAAVSTLSRNPLEVPSGSLCQEICPRNKENATTKLGEYELVVWKLSKPTQNCKTSCKILSNSTIISSLFSCSYFRSFDSFLHKFHHHSEFFGFLSFLSCRNKFKLVFDANQSFWSIEKFCDNVQNFAKIQKIFDLGDFKEGIEL